MSVGSVSNCSTVVAVLRPPTPLQEAQSGSNASGSTIAATVNPAAVQAGAAAVASKLPESGQPVDIRV